MYSGYVKHLSHQQPHGHKHADIYFTLINFSSFGLNLLYNETTLKSGVRVTWKNGQAGSSPGRQPWVQKCTEGWQPEERKGTKGCQP